MIEIVPYSEESHYKLLASWWEGHGWPSLPSHKLPPFGFIAQIDGVPVAGSFAYLDNGGTGVAMMEWSVGNPDSEGRVLIKGIRALFEFMVEELNRIEYDVIFTSCRVAGLIKIFEKCGFKKTDEGMTHLVNIHTN